LVDFVSATYFFPCYYFSFLLSLCHKWGFETSLENNCWFAKVKNHWLKQTIPKFIQDYGLDLNNLVGHGYDGSTIMSGEVSGVQKIIVTPSCGISSHDYQICRYESNHCYPCWMCSAWTGFTFFKGRQRPCCRGWPKT